MRWIFLLNAAKLFLKAHELGIPVIVFTFYRSPGDQVIEFIAGRSRVRFGRHQEWLAIDLALWEDIDKDGVVDKDEIRWKDNPMYTTLGQYWESLGGIWGGRWEDPHDIYHFEWAEGMTV